MPFPVTASYPRLSPSTVFWLDRQIIGDALTNVLKNQSCQEDARSRRVREIKEEGWDLFLRVLADGSVLVTAVAVSTIVQLKSYATDLILQNIDRRPPTLLKQFTLQQSPPSTLSSPVPCLYLLPNPGQTSITLVTSPPLVTFSLELLAFFDGNSDGMRVVAEGLERVPEEESQIVRFVRTPEGKGVGVLRSNGGEAWRVVEQGSKLVRAQRWSAADLVVVLKNGIIVSLSIPAACYLKASIGRNLATYSASDSILTLHSTPPATLSLPPISALFSLPSNTDHESIIGISADLSVIHVHVSDMETLTIRSHGSLPLSRPPTMILPVDPMAWRGTESSTSDAVLLSVSEQGELAFWAPEIGLAPEWRCTGRVQTGRTGLRMAKCSSAKKSALSMVP